MLTIYKKGIKKSWMMGIVPPALVLILIPLIGSLWLGPNGLKTQAKYFQTLLQNDLYKVMLGSLSDTVFTTWEGMIGMYIFMWIEWIIIFVSIFVPVRILSSEIDKNTLDLILSFPVPRWKYLIEKFGVFLTYNSFYLLLIVPALGITTKLLNEDLRYETVILALIGVWLILFALGSMTLLCSVLLLKTNRAMGLSALVVIGQYILTRLGALISSVNTNLDFIQKISIFYYLNFGNIAKWLDQSFEKMIENFIAEAMIVFFVGIIFLTLSLYIFQNKELTI